MTAKLPMLSGELSRDDIHAWMAHRDIDAPYLATNWAWLRLIAPVENGPSDGALLESRKRHYATARLYLRGYGPRLRALRNVFDNPLGSPAFREAVRVALEELEAGRR